MTRIEITLTRQASGDILITPRVAEITGRDPGERYISELIRNTLEELLPQLLGDSGHTLTFAGAE